MPENKKKFKRPAEKMAEKVGKPIVTSMKQPDSILKLGVILLIITFSVALLLAGINELTREKIAVLSQEKFNAAMQTVFPDADMFENLDMEASGSVTEIHEALSGGKTIGHVVRLAPSGFGGKIDFIVGVDKEGKVTGISVIEHNETPGLGSRISDQNFIDRFVGKENSILLIKNKAATGNEVEALSGATISSRAVTNAVNEGLSAVEALKGGAAK